MTKLVPGWSMLILDRSFVLSLRVTTRTQLSASIAAHQPRSTQTRVVCLPQQQKGVDSLFLIFSLSQCYSSGTLLPLKKLSI